MNKFLGTLIFLCYISCVESQTISIRTALTDYPLTVGSEINGLGIVQKGENVEIGIGTEINTGGWLKTISNHNLNFSTNNKSIPTMVLSTSGFVGIGLGLINPAYKLDLGGRLRIRNIANGSTAGIYLDGPTTASRSFIGTLNEDYMGLYGNVVGWGFLMNVENGNTGIGTSAPTAKLDVDGTARIRDNNAKLGAIYVSSDANGTGHWQAPAAFKAKGSVDGSSTNIAGNTWTKLFFNTTTDYNAGLHYQPLASQFVAPVKGIYHFEAQTTWVGSKTSSGIGLGGTRNGNTIITLPYHYSPNGRVPDGGNYYSAVKANIETFSADIKLEAGDIIWLIVYRSTSDQISSDPLKTWFTGRLITTY